MIQQVQPVVGMKGGQQSLQQCVQMGLHGGSGIDSQGIQPGIKGVQISTLGGQFNSQQVQHEGLDGCGFQ